MGTGQNGFRLVVVISLALPVALACGRATEQKGQGQLSSQGASPVVARVNGAPIRIDDLDPRMGLGSAAGRHRAVEAAVMRRLAAEEARDRHLDQEEPVRSELEAIRREAKAREEAVLRDALFAKLRDQVRIPDAEVRAEYERTKALYAERAFRLARIAYPTRAKAEAADRALGEKGRLDPAKAETIGPAPLQQLPRELLPAVLRLAKPGQRVVVPRPPENGKPKAGAWLVELEEIVPAQVPPFQAVRARVEGRLRLLRAQAAFRKELGALRKQAHVTIDDTALANDALWKNAEGAVGSPAPWVRARPARPPAR